MMREARKTYAPALLGRNDGHTSTQLGAVGSRDWNIVFPGSVRAQHQLRRSVPDAVEVHAGRPAPDAAATCSTQHMASSRGVARLRKDAMTAAPPAIARKRVRTQRSHGMLSQRTTYGRETGDSRSCSRRLRRLLRTCRGVGLGALQEPLLRPGARSLLTAQLPLLEG